MRPTGRLSRQRGGRHPAQPRPTGRHVHDGHDPAGLGPVALLVFAVVVAVGTLVVALLIWLGGGA